MKYIQQLSIIPGQITQHWMGCDYVLYQAEPRMPHQPCFTQCDCRMPPFSTAAGCSGFCYRWSNGDSIVFKRVNEVPQDEPIVETRYAEQCRLAMLQHDEREC